jgi:hypothetical protein
MRNIATDEQLSGPGHHSIGGGAHNLASECQSCLVFLRLERGSFGSFCTCDMCVRHKSTKLNTTSERTDGTRNTTPERTDATKYHFGKD